MPGPLIGRRRETGWAGGEARERPVFPARSAGLPWAVLGTGGGAVRPRPGSVPVVLPGRRQVRAAHRAGARRGPPCPVARAPRAGCCPAGVTGCRPPPRGARRPHRGHRRLAACPETWPAVPPASAAARGRRPGALLPGPGRPASAAGARTVSWLMPAAGSGRDAVPGPAPGDRPAPPPGPPGSGHGTGAAVTCAFTAMARIWRGCPGHPRSCRHGLAGLAPAGLPVSPAGSR